MKTTRGDLLALALQGYFDVIIQGCNCQCGMGRGIAAQIREQFPEALEADRATEKGSREKLGTFSFAEISRRTARFTIVNAYTQFHWKGEGILADYDAIRRAFRAIKLQFTGKRIGYPLIGAGLARGDWKTIAAIIEEELAGEDHTLVEYEPVKKAIPVFTEKDRTKLSKFLSLVLRHQPDEIGITLDDAGWVNVVDLLDALERHGKRASRTQLDEVVATNDKKRFTYNDDLTRIRASQGHSVEVDLGYEPATPPELLFHGTATRFLDPIRAKASKK